MRYYPTEIPATASATDLQRKPAEILAQVNANKSPVFILRNNKAEAVIISPQTYTALVKSYQEHEQIKQYKNMPVTRSRLKKGYKYFKA